jgi:Domain of unknown function (DUF4157)
VGDARAGYIRREAGSLRGAAPGRAPGRTMGADPGGLLGLQRISGNQAVAALVGQAEPATEESRWPAGEPLDPATRLSMESHLGHDFSGVRIHSGQAAAQSARHLGAHAFTVGDHIVLGADVPPLRTGPGRHTLAHELTHVVQQRLGGNPPGLDPESAAERDADTAASAMAAGRTPAPVSRGTAVGIARQPVDPRHGRGHSGEQGMGFELYPQSEGWIFFEGPSGAGGHGTTAPGFDGVAYNTRTGELHLIDNKSLKKSGNVTSATAIDPSRNLAKNVDDLITRVEAAKDVPGQGRVLDLLRKTKAAVAAGQPPPAGVKLMVTSVGGQTTDVSARLKSLGVEHHPGTPAKPATPAPPAAAATPAQPATAAPTAKTEPAAHVGSGEAHLHEPGFHPAEIPHGPRSLKVHGGILLAIGIAGVTYLATGSKWAAVQSLNPFANTVDALTEADVSGTEVAVGALKDVVSLTPPGAITVFIWDITRPRGPFPYDQQLYDQAIAEGRNPFCAQCHGPGGALDPNNKWNQQADRKKLEAMMPKFFSVPLAVLSAADQEAILNFLKSPPQ